MGAGVLLSTALALFQAWLGITLAFYTDWPSSFWIALLSAGVYLLTFLPWPSPEAQPGDTAEPSGSRDRA